MRRVLTVMALSSAVMTIPHVAVAICIEESFDSVVRSSDAVLVATVAEAQPEGKGTGVVVRLDPESVFKGSAKDGRVVHVQPCGPALIGEGAREYARQMEGTRDLWLLSDAGGGTFNHYGQVLTPRMTLHERIERARELLGSADDAPTAPKDDPGGSTFPPVVLVALVVIAIVGIVLVARRTPRAG